MNRFEDRIRELRKKAGLSQMELGEKIGVGKTTISNYETGYSTPDNKILAKIADVFGVSVDCLLGRDEGVLSEPNFSEILVAEHIHAGNPGIPLQDTVGKVYLPKKAYNPDDYFGLLIKGDSMNAAKLSDGDIAIIRRQNYAENGEIIVCTIGEEDAIVRRYFRNGKIITLMPESTNKSHNPIIVDVSKEKFRILGKVVQAIINF